MNAYSKTPPTEAGYYWVRHEDKGESVEYIYTNEFDMQGFDEGHDFRLCEGEEYFEFGPRIPSAGSLYVLTLNMGLDSDGSIDKAIATIEKLHESYSKLDAKTNIAQHERRILDLVVSLHLAIHEGGL